jgi:hypothetical protein
MPLYRLGPDSNVYPSLFHECAAPPATSWDSTTVTRLPYLADSAPAHKPPMPAPITTTSVSWLSTAARAARRAREGRRLAMRAAWKGARALPRRAPSAAGEGARPRAPGARIAADIAGAFAGRESRACECARPRRNEMSFDSE